MVQLWLNLNTFAIELVSTTSNCEIFLHKISTPVLILRLQFVIDAFLTLENH